MPLVLLVAIPLVAALESGRLYTHFSDLRLQAQLHAKNRAWWEGTQFTLDRMACGPDVHVYTYTLSDGDTLYEGGIHYDSHHSADTAVHDWIASGVVVDRGRTTDPLDGRETERIVLVHDHHRSSDPGHASILWYDHECLLSFIDAPSLTIALAFERARASDHQDKEKAAG
jgi:hypothetical protein